MFKLDSSFLEGVGLGEMPESERGAFLDHLQEELEVRIGQKMSEGLSEEQIVEFEKVIDGDDETVKMVLAGVGDYSSDENYAKLREASGLQEGSPELLAEFASMKWLQKNRPDYQEIVENEAKSLRDEVTKGKDTILENGVAE